MFVLCVHPRGGGVAQPGSAQPITLAPPPTTTGYQPTQHPWHPPPPAKSRTVTPFPNEDQDRVPLGQKYHEQDTARVVRLLLLHAGELSCVLLQHLSETRWYTIRSFIAEFDLLTGKSLTVYLQTNCTTESGRLGGRRCPEQLGWRWERLTLSINIPHRNSRSCRQSSNCSSFSASRGYKKFDNCNTAMVMLILGGAGASTGNQEVLFYCVESFALFPNCPFHVPSIDPESTLRLRQQFIYHWK